MEETTLAMTQTYTAEEVFELEGDERRELIDGELTTLAGSGGQASGVAVAIAIEIGIYLKTNPIGRVTGEAGGYVVSRNPDVLFCPDAAFIRFERLPDRTLPPQFIDTYPDLVIEVHSPYDRKVHEERKIERYLSAGTSLVWLVNPKTEIVTVHRLDQAPRRLTKDDILSGEDVLPGFAIPIRAIFD